MKVELPETPAEVQKERAPITDDELEILLTHPEVDLELQLMAPAARCEGGMHTNRLRRCQVAPKS